MMKKLKLILYVLLVFFLNQTVVAQDSYFTQFDTAPSIASPALTGYFDGHFRVNSNYRTQQGFDDVFDLVNYRTLAISADSKINLGPSTNLGVGLSYKNDLPVGSLNFQQAQYQLNTAINHTISTVSSATHTLAFGLNSGLGVSNIDQSDAFVWPSEHDENGGSTTIDPPATPELLEQVSYGSFSLGAIWSFAKNTTHFSSQIGYTIHGFNGRKNSFVVDSNATSNPFHTLYGMVELPVNNRISLIPTVHFVKQGSVEQLLYGISPRYYFKEKDRFVQLGIFAKSTQTFHPSTDYFSIFSSTLRVDLGAIAFGFTYEQFFNNDIRIPAAYEFSLGYRLE